MKTKTDLYENSHGTKPRGTGHWMIEVTGTDGHGSYTTETYSHYGRLTEAKANAAKRLKEECSRVKHIAQIIILP